MTAKALRLMVVTVAAAVLAFALAIFSLDAVAAAGEVESMRGTGALQRDGRPPQLLGKGMAVEQGDIITTGPNSQAILKLSDGTRMTLTADSRMMLHVYAFNPAARDDESAGTMLLGLFKGGLRTVTGLIPKREVEAARIITSTATVGIRGTDFDVRVCGRDCVQSATNTTASAPTVLPGRSLAIQASARVMRMQGRLFATPDGGARRALMQGGSLYPGDVIESEPGAYAVLVFRDESLLTVQPASRVKIEDFVFDKVHPAEGRVLVGLMQGGMRAFSGLIARANYNNVVYRTPTATVGIRGTGVDLLHGCRSEEPAAPSLATGSSLAPVAPAVQCIPVSQVSVLSGAVVVSADPATCSGSCSIELGVGQNALVDASGGGVFRVEQTIANFIGPDQIPAGTDEFDVTPPSPDSEGTYVYVRDGDVQIRGTDGNLLNLGRNEAGYSGDGVAPRRLGELPQALDLQLMSGGVLSGVQVAFGMICR